MECLFGFAKLQLKYIKFSGCQTWAVRRLKTVIKSSCEDHLWKNQFPVRVTPSELDEMISYSAGITKEDLHKTLLPMLATSNIPNPAKVYKLPELTSNVQIEGLFGKQRHDTAKEYLGEDFWWTVRIYVLPEKAKSPFDLSYQEDLPSLTAIELYLTANDQPDRADELINLPQYTKGIKRLCSSEINQGLFRLAVFGAALDDLQFGSIEKHLATHMYPEMNSALKNLYDHYNTITLGCRQVQSQLDPATISGLALRVPFFHDDKIEIINSIKSGKFFPNVKDARLRQQIETKILQSNSVFPSLKAFHENVSYLAIAANIIKDLVVPNFSKESMYENLSKIWHTNSPKSCLLELQHGEDAYLKPAHLPTSYVGLILLSLRLFAYISRPSPRTGAGESVKKEYWTIDKSRIAFFLEKVQRLGFNTLKVEEKLGELRSEGVTAIAPDPVRVVDFEAELEYRCGRPFHKAYELIQKELYISRLLSTQEETNLSGSPTIMFVHRDIIWSFFGQYLKEISKTLQCPLSEVVKIGNGSSELESSERFKSGTIRSEKMEGPQSPGTSIKPSPVPAIFGSGPRDSARKGAVLKDRSRKNRGRRVVRGLGSKKEDRRSFSLAEHLHI